MAVEPIISWREPMSSYRPRFIAELEHTGTFSVWFWVRVYLLSALVAGLAVGAMYLFQPGFHMPPQVFAAPLVIPLFIFLRLGMLYLIPPTIRISPRRIHISHSDGSHAIDRSKPLAASISADEAGRPTLTLRYTSRGGIERTKTYGIANGIDLAELHAAITGESQQGIRQQAQGTSHARTL